MKILFLCEEVFPMYFKETISQDWKFNAYFNFKSLSNVLFAQRSRKEKIFKSILYTCQRIVIKYYLAKKTHEIVYLRRNK